MRLPNIDPHRLSEEQRRLALEIGKTRAGAVRGPFAIWMRIPGLARRANDFGNVLRVEGALDKRLFELAILLVARHWTAQYEWFIHTDAARQYGVPENVIEAIKCKRSPILERDADRVVFAVVSELIESRTLGEVAYRKAVAALGIDGLIELVTVVGFYAMVAMLLNVFDVPVPEGKPQLAPDGDMVRRGG